MLGSVRTEHLVQSMSFTFFYQQKVIQMHQLNGLISQMSYL